MIKERIARVEEILSEKKLDAILVTKDENLQYFSGFCGDSAMLVIARGRRFLLTDSRYTEQASVEAEAYEIVQQKDGLYSKAGEVLRDLGCKSIGFEGDSVSFSNYERMRKFQGVENISSVQLDALRMIKVQQEIQCIEEACKIADEAFSETCKFLRSGLREYEIAAYIEHCMRSMGSERAAFQTIVASGVRGSLPHGTASDKILAEGELVTIDFGAVFRGYHSDITRTVCIGKADTRQREIYEAVLAAQLVALPEIKTGASGRRSDEIARAELKKYGLDEYFGHGLGHGVGLEIHEEPRLSSKSSTEYLLENMVVTDEPGVYIPGWGGIRIEDTVRVASNGGVTMTKSRKDFIEIF